RNSPAAVQQLVGGHASIVRMSSLVLVRTVAEQQAPLIAVASDYQQSVFQVTSLASRSVNSLAALSGKTIGLQSLGGGGEEAFDALLKINGIDKGSVKRLAAGSGAGAVAFLLDHRADAILTTFDQESAIRRAGSTVSSFNMSGPNPVFGEVFVVTKATFAKQADKS